MGWDHYFLVGPQISVFVGNIIFFQRVVVDKNLSGNNPHTVTAHPDHALNKALRRVTWIAKYDNVATFDRLPAVNEFIDENAFLVVERRHHAGALNFYRLVKEDDDEAGNRQGYDQVPEPRREKREPRPGSRCVSFANSRCRL